MDNTTFPAKTRHLELSIPYLIMFKYPDLTGLGNTQVTQETKRTQHWLPGGLVKMTRVVSALRVGWVCINLVLLMVVRKLSVRDTLVAC